VRRPGRGGEFGFERLDFRAENEPSAGEDPFDSLAHRGVIFSGP